LDIYGRVRIFVGRSLSDCPFRYQGQYEDAETGLYYNRFRYYDPSIGSYISQDPIRLDGENRFYSYVHDVNSWFDVFGLGKHHSDPKFMGGDPKQPLTNVPNVDHVQLHRDLNAHLDTQKIVNGKTASMRPKRGNSGTVIQTNFIRQQRLDALAEFYTVNKTKYPDAATDFFAQHPHL
jgi:RHS repeat-associated protein